MIPPAVPCRWNPCLSLSSVQSASLERSRPFVRGRVQKISGRDLI
jgi:hypothetical protein